MSGESISTTSRLILRTRIAHYTSVRLVTPAIAYDYYSSIAKMLNALDDDTIRAAVAATDMYGTEGYANGFINDLKKYLPEVAKWVVRMKLKLEMNA